MTVRYPVVKMSGIRPNMQRGLEIQKQYKYKTSGKERRFDFVFLLLRSSKTDLEENLK